MSEQSTKPKHEESQREREERRAALLAQYEVPKKITSRKLDSDLPTLPPVPPSATKDRPKYEPETRFQKKRRFRYYGDICAGVVVIAALAFMVMPKEWVNRKDEVVPASPERPPAPAPSTAPVYANAADWVAKVRIGGVLSTRILIDGKPCVRELPVGPFSVRWIRRDNHTLIFQGPDGTEYRRELAR